MRTAVRHSMVYGLGTVLAKAIGFLMLPLYTHYLSPRDYGILEILDMTISLIGMFLNMGITAALLRYYNTCDIPAERRKVVSTAFLFVIGTGVVAWLIAALLARPVTSLLFSAAVPATYFLISFSSFTLGYITNVPNAYMQAREASGTLVLTDTFTLLLMLALNVYFVAFAQIGLVGILLSPLLAGSIKATLFAWWTIRDVGFGFSGAWLREMVVFGAPLIFSNLALFTLNFSDRFFLQHYQSLAAVGIYAVGYKFGYLLNVAIAQPFYVMWQARMYVIQGRPGCDGIMSRMFIFYSFLLVFGALALSLLRGEIVDLMVDARFSASQGVIPIVALAYVVFGVGYFLQAGLLLALRTRTIAALSARRRRDQSGPQRSAGAAVRDVRSSLGDRPGVPGDHGGDLLLLLEVVCQAPGSGALFRGPCSGRGSVRHFPGREPSIPGNGITAEGGAVGGISRAPRRHEAPFPGRTGHFEFRAYQRTFIRGTDTPGR